MSSSISPFLSFLPVSYSISFYVHTKAAQESGGGGDVFSFVICSFVRMKCVRNQI